VTCRCCRACHQSRFCPFAAQTLSPANPYLLSWAACPYHGCPAVQPAGCQGSNTCDMKMPFANVTVSGL
jgi:hypothetical protein